MHSVNMQTRILIVIYLLTLETLNQYFYECRSPVHLQWLTGKNLDQGFLQTNKFSLLYVDAYKLDKQNKVLI